MHANIECFFSANFINCGKKHIIWPLISRAKPSQYEEGCAWDGIRKKCASILNNLSKCIRMQYLRISLPTGGYLKGIMYYSVI